MLVLFGKLEEDTPFHKNNAVHVSRCTHRSTGGAGANGGGV
jgi:hypothetical protein